MAFVSGTGAAATVAASGSLVFSVSELGCSGFETVSFSGDLLVSTEVDVDCSV